LDKFKIFCDISHPAFDLISYYSQVASRQSLAPTKYADAEIAELDVFAQEANRINYFKVIEE